MNCRLYPDCERPARSAGGEYGLCEIHYRRLRKYGDPSAGWMPRGVRGKKPCTIDDCPRLIWARWLCKVHYHYLARYGEEGLEVVKRRQAGAPCDACGVLREGEMHIDHCHETGRVRGLLCMSCNMTLGYVKDDPGRLRALTSYLEGAMRAAC